MCYFAYFTRRHVALHGPDTDGFTEISNAAAIDCTSKNTNSWANFVWKREATKPCDVKSTTFGGMGPKGLRVVGTKNRADPKVCKSCCHKTNLGNYFDDPTLPTGSLRCACVYIAARRLDYCTQEAFLSLSAVYILLISALFEH